MPDGIFAEETCQSILPHTMLLMVHSLQGTLAYHPQIARDAEPWTQIAFLPTRFINRIQKFGIIDVDVI